MSIKKFFESVLPSLERSRIVNSLEKTYRMIDDTVVPALEVQDSLVNKLPLYTNIDRILGSVYGPDDYRGDVIRYLRDTAETMVKQRSEILSLIEKSFSKNIEVEAIDYKRANLLEYVACIAYFADYASKLTYTLTAQAIDDSYAKKGVVAEYAEFLGDTEEMRTFAVVVTAMRKEAKDLSKALEAIKSISFDPETHDMMQRTHGKKLDPLRMNMLPGVGHLSLLAGQIYNAISVYWIKRNEQILEGLRWQVLYLERDLADADDSVSVKEIEDQIKYYRGQIAKAESRIEQG